MCNIKNCPFCGGVPELTSYPKSWYTTTPTLLASLSGKYLYIALAVVCSSALRLRRWSGLEGTGWLIRKLFKELLKGGIRGYDKSVA